MHDIILVSVNMFSMNQTIDLSTGEQISVKLSELPDAILETCYNTIDFIKGNKVYISKIKKAVKQKEMAKYNHNKINFIGEN